MWNEYDPDPFTQAYRALRTWYLADDQLRFLVKAANFPDLTSTTSRNPIKDNVQDADLPEVLIEPLGSRTAIGRTNTGHAITKRWAIRIASGQLTLHGKLHPVEFAIFAASARLHRRKSRLELPFVELIKFNEASTGLTDSEKSQRGTQGWTTLQVVEITFAFSDNDLNA